MARKSRKSKELEKEILSNVPVEQRKMITQPITYTYLNGEMSMTQTRIQTMIMERLQDRITKALARKASGGYTGDLFTDDDFKPLPGGKTPFLTFEVRYSELGVLPANYKDVDEAARAMQSIVYEKDVTDEHGLPAKEYTVVFDKVTIPEKDKSGESSVRRDSIKLRMLPETAHDVFNLSRYHRYLKDAIFQFSSNYAGRIYLMINANKNLGTWSISYESLRKILLTSYDRETKKVTVDKYRAIGDFKKRVLEPARKEILEAADRIDCTFDYEFTYPAGKRRGTPENVVFHIHLTDLGRNISRALLESQEASELRKLLLSLHLNAAEASRLMKEAWKQLPSAQYSRLMKKALELRQYYAENTVNDMRAYTLTSLRNFIAEQAENPDPVEQQPVEMEEWGD